MGIRPDELTCEEKAALELCDQEGCHHIFCNQPSVQQLVDNFWPGDDKARQLEAADLIFLQRICPDFLSNGAQTVCGCHDNGDPCGADEVRTGCDDPDQCPNRTWGLDIVAVLRATVHAMSLAYIPVAGIEYPDWEDPSFNLDEMSVLAWDPSRVPQNRSWDKCRPKTGGAFVPMKLDVGEQGIQGITGPMGPSGADGADGAEGAPGPAGPQGEIGPAGAQGQQGLPGVPGAPGANGTNGTNGVDGADGADGAPGADGADGADGVDGEDADKCSTAEMVLPNGDPVSVVINSTTGAVSYFSLPSGTELIDGTGGFDAQTLQLAQAEVACEPGDSDSTLKIGGHEIYGHTPRIASHPFVSQAPGGNLINQLLFDENLSLIHI